jgi:tetratricopeptide (TPR) repeat protein
MKNLILLALLLFSPIVYSQGAGAEWEASIKEFDTLLDNKKYEKLIPVAKKSVDIAKQKVGGEHPDMATSFTKLAIAYDFDQKDDQALILYKQALFINEKAFGVDHLKVADSLRALSNVYHPKDTIPIEYRILSIYEKNASKDDTKVKIKKQLKWIALKHEHFEQYDQALIILDRVLAIDEKAFDEVSIAFDLKNISEIFEKQNKYDKTLPLLSRAKEIIEKRFFNDSSLGLGFIDILEIMARMYKIQHQYDNAISVLEEQLKIKKLQKFQDSKHDFEDVASLHYKLGHYQQALPFYQRAMALCAEDATQGVLTNYETELCTKIAGKVDMLNRDVH